MSGLYQFMSIGLGVILFGFFLAGIMIVIRNLKKRMLPGYDVKTSILLAETYWEEKREHVRVGIVWPVSIENSHGPIKAKTKDISLGGAFIACDNPLPLKELFSLSVNIPGPVTLSLNSEVVWSNAGVPEERVVTRGMGVRFLGMTAQDRNVLNKAISNFLEDKSV